jgi:hypothetical protein
MSLESIALIKEFFVNSADIDSKYRSESNDVSKISDAFE